MSKLKNKLSRLTFNKACKMLGPEGKALLAEGGKIEFDIENDVTMDANQFSISRYDFSVSIDLEPSNDKKLRVISSTGRNDCVEVASVLSLILEEKMTLGLATPPPVESLSPEALREEALCNLANVFAGIIAAANGDKTSGS